jgi:hypothetical protein
MMRSCCHRLHCPFLDASLRPSSRRPVSCQGHLRIRITCDVPGVRPGPRFLRGIHTPGLCREAKSMDTCTRRRIRRCPRCPGFRAPLFILTFASGGPERIAGSTATDVLHPTPGSTGGDVPLPACPQAPVRPCSSAISTCLRRAVYIRSHVYRNFFLTHVFG